MAERVLVFNKKVFDLNLNRDVCTRLWETYASDLSKLLELFKNKIIDFNQFEKFASMIIPVMNDLKHDGSIARSVRKSDLVILKRMMPDLEEVSQEISEEKVTKSMEESIENQRKISQEKRRRKAEIIPFENEKNFKQA